MNTSPRAPAIGHRTAVHWPDPRSRVAEVLHFCHHVPDAMFLPFLISAMLAGDPRVLPPSHGTAQRAIPRTDEERARAVFDERLAAYVGLAGELGSELIGHDFDDRLAELLDDERMTTYLGLAAELARDLGGSPSLREFAESLEQVHLPPEGPLFERPEVRAFVVWLEELGERGDVETLLRLTTSVPPSLLSAEAVGRGFVHVLYDPALTTEMRAMLYATVRIAGRCAVLYHARGGDLDDSVVAELFASQEDDARELERLYMLLMSEAGELGPKDAAASIEFGQMHEQIAWNRTLLDAWMAGIRAAQG